MVVADANQLIVDVLLNTLDITLHLFQLMHFCSYCVHFSEALLLYLQREVLRSLVDILSLLYHAIEHNFHVPEVHCQPCRLLLSQALLVLDTPEPLAPLCDIVAQYIAPLF